VKAPSQYILSLSKKEPVRSKKYLLRAASLEEGKGGESLNAEGVSQKRSGNRVGIQTGGGVYLDGGSIGKKSCGQGWCGERESLSNEGQECLGKAGGLPRSLLLGLGRKERS